MVGKLLVKYDADEKTVAIYGDADGLKILSDICLKRIGKKGPAAHFHFMESMENVEKGSINMDVIYLETAQFDIKNDF